MVNCFICFNCKIYNCNFRYLLFLFGIRDVYYIYYFNFQILVNVCGKILYNEILKKYVIKWLSCKVFNF